jgi:uncharacterized protein with NRDE domain
MCTLIVLHRCYDDAPLVVAANRDEFHARPAEGPALTRSGSRRVAAPRDVEAGGTWLGVNDAGLFAAITNRPTAEKQPSHRSRGLVVMDALAESSAKAATARLMQLAASSYNPFNVVLADGRDAFVVIYEEKPLVTQLAQGAHVIGNADPDSARVPKVARLLAEAQRVAVGRSEDALQRLARLCGGHDGSGPPIEDTCIHAGPYGTRCSMLLQRKTDPAEDQFLFADGPPCETEYEDLTPLLAALDPKTGSRSPDVHQRYP